jgi:HEAT repeats
LFMNEAKYLVSTLFCFIAGAMLLYAPGGAPASLDKLVAASDDIVVGKIIDGASSGVTVSLSLEVERALKGPLATGAIVGASGAASQAVMTHPVAQERGIFFLSAASGGILRVVPPLNGYLTDERSTFIPLPSSGYEVQPGTSPKEQVMLEVLGALESGRMVQPGGTIDLLGEFHADPSSNVRLVFQRWMTGSSSSRLTAIALRALVAEGDIGALTRIASDDSLESTQAAASLYEALKLFKNPDPTSVALLGRLATTSSTNTSLRAAAATALARMHTQRTLPYLAQLLGEQNISLVTAAVGGLSSFANNVPIGSHQPAAGPWSYRSEDTIAHSAFDERLIAKQESYFVSFWSDWWHQNESKLSQ